MAFKTTIVLGIGIKDLAVCENGLKCISYVTWYHLLERCSKSKNVYGSYHDCELCEEWKTYSNFKKWFDDNYKDSYQLDKDILFKGNRLYSPQTCRFIPRQINTLITTHKKDRGEYPIGVTFCKRDRSFVSKIRKYGVRYNVGTFSNPEDAFYAYKLEKEKHIKEVAEKYYNEGNIDIDIYNALCAWTISITD